MLHTMAGLSWTPFVSVLRYGIAGYVLGKGLLGTLSDLCDLGIRLLED